MEVNYYPKRLYYKEKVINLLAKKSKQMPGLNQALAIQNFDWKQNHDTIY